MPTQAEIHYSSFIRSYEKSETDALSFSRGDTTKVLNILRQCVAHYMRAKDAQEATKHRKAFLNVLGAAKKKKHLLQRNAAELILRTVKDQFEKAPIDETKGTNLTFMLDELNTGMRLKVKALYLEAQYKNFMSSYEIALKHTPPDTETIENTLKLLKNKDMVNNILDKCVSNYINTDDPHKQDKNLTAFLLVLDHAKNNGLFDKNYIDGIFRIIESKKGKTNPLISMGKETLSSPEKKPTFRDLKSYMQTKISSKEKELGLQGKGKFVMWFSQLLAQFTGNKTRANNINTLITLKETEKKSNVAGKKDIDILTDENFPEGLNKHNIKFDHIQRIVKDKEIAKIISTARETQSHHHRQFHPSITPTQQRTHRRFK